MARSRVTCPRCGADVRQVSHTVGEPPRAMPCEHPVDYRFTPDGGVRLTARAAAARPLAPSPPGW